MALSLNTSPCPPPSRFKGCGEVERVRPLAGVPPFALGKRRAKGAKAAGLRYEKRVRQELEAQFGPAASFRYWLEFYQKGTYKRGLCELDALIQLRDGVLCIIEAKIKHTSDAWWQLRKLYQPLIQTLYPEHRVLVCEVCKFLDPAVPFPEPIVMVTSPDELDCDGFGVCMWKL